MQNIMKHPPLYKLLQEYERTGYFDDWSKFNETLDQALEDKWISTVDELPPYHVGVLLYIVSEDHITSGMRDESDKWVLLDEYREVPSTDISHWRRLPNKPATK